MGGGKPSVNQSPKGAWKGSPRMELADTPSQDHGYCYADGAFEDFVHPRPWHNYSNRYGLGAENLDRDLVKFFQIVMCHRSSENEVALSPIDYQVAWSDFDDVWTQLCSRGVVNKRRQLGQSLLAWREKQFAIAASHRGT